MAIENNGNRTAGGTPTGNGNGNKSGPAASTGAGGGFGGQAGEGFGADFQDLLGGQLSSLSSIGETVGGFIRERPGTSILIALGAGFIIGRLMRD